MKQEQSLAKENSQVLQMRDETNREIILTYLEAEGEGIVLTEKQQELLERWTFAADELRKNLGKRKRSAVADMIMEKYGVKRATAFQDIVNAEYVYSSSFPRNIKFFVDARMEFLEKAINDAYHNREFDAVARLEKVLQGYASMYPKNKTQESPRKMVFILNGERPKKEDVQDAEVLLVETAKKKLDADNEGSLFK